MNVIESLARRSGRFCYFCCLPVLLILPVDVPAAETFVQPPIVLSRFEESEADIRVDGILDEDAWASLPSYDYFRVLNPDTLEEVPYATEVKLFYTGRGLYVGVRAEQPPDTLIARLSSRDSFVPRDGVSLTLDPSGEGRYGYWFGINFGGSLGDGTVLPERQFNSRWDGPWRGASAVLDDGYSVEYFLPFSMIPMPVSAADTRKMGIYISRQVAHRGETWGWPALPTSQSRFLSSLQFIEMDTFKPRTQFTFYPFSSSSYDIIAGEDDHKAGFDVFWRPGSNLQLTATVNPDFGNVEADDVVVNLTAFETFFPEKRPFFLEGHEIFNTSPRTRGSSPVILVHTRRIGAPPERLDNLTVTGLEASQPSELIGAAKVTGQKGDWRYGVMAAVEDETKIEGLRDDVDIDLVQDGRTFGVARLLYENTSGANRSGLGWITTVVDHPDTEAVVHGIDGHYLSERGVWQLDGQLLYSDVDGVSGTGGLADITYTPRQGMRHSLELDYFDDDLNINDFGFLRRNDSITARYTLKLQQSALRRLRNRETTVTLFQQYNTDGQAVRSGLFFRQNRSFHNNHQLFTELNYFPARWDDRNSGGNGSYRIEPRWQAGANWSSDNAKPVQLGLGYTYRDEDIGGNRLSYQTRLRWRPSDRFSAHVFLEYEKRSGWLVHDSGRDFTTFNAESWRPRIEIDYFLSAKQQFRLAMQWVGVRAFEKNRWQVPVEGGSLIRDQRTVTEARDFTISRMSFQARYRWELAPLSDLFVVYTRGSRLTSRPGEDFDDLLSDSWTDRAADILVVKLRYRFGS